jgi:hypothetical protein
MATSFTLPDHPTLPKGKTVAVIVLDGWGEASADQYNCIHRAETPVMDSLKNVCSFAAPLSVYLSCLIMVDCILDWCKGWEYKSFSYAKTHLV